MKKIIITFLFFILNIFFSYTYSDSTWNWELLLKVSESKVNLNSDFTLTFSINLPDSSDFENIKIGWLEKFHSLWESSSFSFQDINWVKKSIYTMNIKLKPINLWNFIIWPAIVKLWDKELESNSIEVEVIWYNGLFWTWTSTWSNEMTDIHDIKWPKNYFNFSFWFIVVFLVFLFFIWYHYILKYYISWKDNEKINKEKIDEPVDKNTYFLNKLSLIEKETINSSKSDFFSLLNDYLREFIEYKWINGASKMTFKELEKHKLYLDKDLFNLLKNTYYEEFRENESFWFDRKELIKNIKKHIK